MSLKKAAGIGLTFLGAALLAGGIYVGPQDDPGMEQVRIFAMFLGGALVVGGVALIIGRDVVFLPWGFWGPYWYALHCYIAGVAMMLMSLFPLSLALRDPFYRALGLATFVGAILAGVGFVAAGRMFGRKIKR